MLKAVLFDMDGVLVDSEGAYYELEAKIARELGFVFTKEEHVAFAGVRTFDFWTALKERHGFDADPHELTERVSSAMAEFYKMGDLQPYKDSLALLRECAQSGLKTAIATSSNKRDAGSVIDRFGLAPYVQAVSTSCIAGKSKPEPDIFLLAADMLDTDPGACIVIEDSACGLTAAKAAGMKAVGLRHADRPADLSLADVVVDTLGALSVEALRAMI